MILVRFTCLPCLLLVLFLGLLVGVSLLHASGEAEQRAAMVREIETNVRETSQWLGRGGLDPNVMKVMGQVPRHMFVPSAQQPYAYENRPLSIGYGQTISQPYIVALMTDLLKPQKNDVVLEIGTGSGYQAAVLSQLVDKVYTIEIVPPLYETATERLQRLGFSNVHTRRGDGYYGWPDSGPASLKSSSRSGPFDGIIVTAAASHVPPPLLAQLKPGGRMVIPVGGPFSTQQLLLIEKDAAGSLTTRQILPVRFVPFRREP